jgi:hypothetical protein
VQVEDLGVMGSVSREMEDGDEDGGWTYVRM